jgi:hypothetical protein
VTTDWIDQVPADRNSDPARNPGSFISQVDAISLHTEFGAHALRYMPVMAAYKDVLTNIRGVLHNMDGAQPGDPAKAARAVALAIESDSTPLRLQLGADSIAAVRAHAEQLLSDLRKWERVGTETTLDRAAA